MSPDSTPMMYTTGNSSPFAACMVIRVTAPRDWSTLSTSLVRLANSRKPCSDGSSSSSSSSSSRTSDEQKLELGGCDLSSHHTEREGRKHSRSRSKLHEMSQSTESNKLWANEAIVRIKRGLRNVDKRKAMIAEYQSKLQHGNHKEQPLQVQVTEAEVENTYAELKSGKRRVEDLYGMIAKQISTHQ